MFTVWTNSVMSCLGNYSSTVAKVTCIHVCIYMYSYTSIPIMVGSDMSCIYTMYVHVHVHRYVHSRTHENALSHEGWHLTHE